MADNDQVLARLEKQNEGITLGLGALAEVLQKMEGRFQKQAESEDEDAAKEAAETEDDELEAMYKSLVRDVSKSVTRIVKQDNKMAELNQNKSKKVSGTGWPMSSRSKPSIDESGADTLDNSSTESVQMPIEAMEKAIAKAVSSVLRKSPVRKSAVRKSRIRKGGYGRIRNQEEDLLDRDDETEVEEELELNRHQNRNGNGNGKEMYPVEEQDLDEEEALEEPVLEDDEEGTDVAAMMRNMQKQITNLKKHNTTLTKGMEKNIRKETETRLRKMGFREEKGLAGARLMPQSSMGASEPLIKGSTQENVVEQLAGLSWNELNEMRFKIETGNTDGIPRELLG